jgi:hypothetical protein
LAAPNDDQTLPQQDDEQAITAICPATPSSSPMTAKMKSERASGR